MEKGIVMNEFLSLGGGFEVWDIRLIVAGLVAIIIIVAFFYKKAKAD